MLGKVAKLRQMVVLMILFGISIMTIPGEGGRLPVPASVQDALNEVIRLSVELNKQILGTNSEALDEAVVHLYYALGSAILEAHEVMPEHERAHIGIYLLAAQQRLIAHQASQDSSHNRMEQLREASQQIVNLMSSYTIGQGYRALYCPEDRSHWIQPLREATRHPFRRHLRSCGVRSI